MYSYVRAIAQKNEDNAHWEEVDLKDELLYEIFPKYKGVYIVLSHPIVVGDLTLNLYDLYNELSTYQGTLAQWLVANDDGAIPTTAGVPVIERKHATYCDAHQAGFSVVASNRLLGDNGIGQPVASLPDALVRHPNGIDYEEMRSTMLAQVNGLYHFTDFNSSGYHIIDANKTRMKSNRNYVGLYSFGAIGKMTLEPITEDMLVFEEGTDGLIRQVHVKCKNGLCGKKAFMVLGGYILMPDDATLVVNTPGVMTLKTRRYPFAERYHESYDTIEMPGIDFPKVDDNPGLVVRDLFLKEAFLKAYFTLSQSFVVILDVDELIYEREYVERDKVPHTYLSYKPPRYPLVVGRGRHDTYWTQEEAQVWVLRGDRCITDTQMSGTVSAAERPYFDDSLYGYRAQTLSQAFLLKISKEEVTIKVE